MTEPQAAGARLPLPDARLPLDAVDTRPARGGAARGGEPGARAAELAARRAAAGEALRTVGLQPDPIGTVPSPASAWNIANALTVLRLLLVPVFAVLLVHGSGHETAWRVLACVVFALASVTDRLDGELARRRNLVTEFGKLADPIADKALVGTALVGLSVLGDLWWWVTAVILARELGVTLLRFWVLRHGVIPASRGGKAKTLLQSLAIGLYVLPLTGWPRVLAAVVMGLALALAVITGVDYVARALRLRRAAHAPSA